MLDRCPYDLPTVETAQSWGTFLYFVWEREAIRMARENGYEKPWTIDPIFDKYKFCNIRRRDDRVTRWLIDNIYSEMLPDDDMWFAAAICRLINWPPTLHELNVWSKIPPLAEEFDTGGFVAILEELRDKKVPKIYTGAYMIYPGRETGSNKSEFLARSVLEPLIPLAPQVRKAVASNLVENVVDALSRSFGISTFIAGQIAADLTYFDHQLGKAHDLYEYAPLGPGSQQGLNYVLGEKVGKQWKQEEFNRWMRVANQRIKDKLGIDDLTLHDVQNCFCEVGKYIRTLHSGGKATPRSVYRPETAF